MNIREAAQKGIKRLRKPNWAQADSYVRITVFPDGCYGPWMYPFGDTEYGILHKNFPEDYDTYPQPIFVPGEDDDDYEEYTGERSKEDKDIE